jgi:hypothetical protein
MFQPLERYLSWGTNWGNAGTGIDESGCGFVPQESNNWKCCIMSSAVDRVVESYIMESLFDGTRKAWKVAKLRPQILIKGIFWYKIYIRVPLSGGFWSGRGLVSNYRLKSTCRIVSYNQSMFSLRMRVHPYTANGRCFASKWWCIDKVRPPIYWWVDEQWSLPPTRTSAWTRRLYIHTNGSASIATGGRD